MRTFIFLALLLFSFNLFAAEARVVSVSELWEDMTEYKQICHQVVEQRRSIGGTLLGGAIGAAIGNQVGEGSGRDIATAVGAVTGAAIGQNVAGDNQVTTQQCTNQPFTTRKVTGYNITVDVNGTYHVVRRQNHPAIGTYIPVNLTVQ